MVIKQGHRYSYKGQDVMAVTDDQELPSVAPIDHSQPYALGLKFFAPADQLIPLPMSYYHGQTPK